MPAGAGGVRVLLALASAFAGAGACMSADSAATRRAERHPYLDTDSMGVVPRAALTIPLQARPELVENSAAALSRSQPGVFFTINDSGNDPVLFALDTTGADRGAWRVRGATNDDWEAVSVGPCGVVSNGAVPNECVYIGDTGDNVGKYATRVIYRLPEPRAERVGFMGDVGAEALPYRYPDGPHDVEAMYVGPSGHVFLITKRPLADAAGRLRPALVFVLPASAWGDGRLVTAKLIDSLPIVPGSAPLRTVTDASLSADGHTLAVRTYAQVYTFATDSLTGRVRGAIPPGVCNVIETEVWPGEGVTWFGRSGMLLLTSEGRDSPMHAVDCPMPRSEP